MANQMAKNRTAPRRRKFVAISDTQCEIHNPDGTVREFTARGRRGLLYETTGQPDIDAGVQLFERPPGLGGLDTTLPDVAVACDGMPIVERVRKYTIRANQMAKNGTAPRRRRRYVAISDTQCEVHETDGNVRKFAARGSEGHIYDITEQSAGSDGVQLFERSYEIHGPDSTVPDVAVSCDGMPIVERVRLYVIRQDRLSNWYRR